jgi:hypothetical protein
MVTTQQQKAGALADAASLAGREDEALWRAMRHLWDVAFEQGRLAALDELQDRFCVCMK